MKITNLNIVLAIVMVITFMCSCELEDKVIELPPHDSRLVLNSQIIQSDTVSRIILTESVSITDTFLNSENTVFNDNASMTLYTPDQGAIEGYIYRDADPSDNVQLPFWKFDYDNYIEGATYSIEAESDGREMISAETVVPEQPQLIDVKVNLREAPANRFFSRDRFEITINDPAGEENYYQIQANFLINEGGFEYLRNYRFYDAPENPIDESFLENRITILNDKSFDGREHTFVAYGERGSYDFSEITFTIFQISKEAYEYQEAYERFNSDSPFSEPVTFPNNIENGFGIFSITSKPAIKLIQI